MLMGSVTFYIFLAAINVNTENSKPSPGRQHIKFQIGIYYGGIKEKQRHRKINKSCTIEIAGIPAG